MPQLLSSFISQTTSSAPFRQHIEAMQCMLSGISQLMINVAARQRFLTSGSDCRQQGLLRLVDPDSSMTCFWMKSLLLVGQHTGSATATAENTSSLQVRPLLLDTPAGLGIQASVSLSPRALLRAESTQPVRLSTQDIIGSSNSIAKYVQPAVLQPCISGPCKEWCRLQSIC